MKPTTFFDDVFIDRTAKLRDQADWLREELERANDSEHPTQSTDGDDDW